MSKTLSSSKIGSNQLSRSSSQGKIESNRTGSLTKVNSNAKLDSLASSVNGGYL